MVDEDTQSSVMLWNWKKARLVGLHLFMNEITVSTASCQSINTIESRERSNRSPMSARVNLTVKWLGFDPGIGAKAVDESMLPFLSARIFLLDSDHVLILFRTFVPESCRTMIAYLSC